MKEYIQAELTKVNLLCQLTEECGELVQAAMKLVRILEGKNPTPVTYEEAMDNLHEEIADIKLCLKMLELDGPNERQKHSYIMEVKTDRWADRIREDREKRT